MTATLIIAALAALAVAGLLLSRRRGAGGAAPPDPLDDRLRDRLAELGGEFGPDVARLMFAAAIDDLDRHLAVLKGQVPPLATETEAEMRARSVHSAVGIAGTLGCDDLARQLRGAGPDAAAVDAIDRLRASLVRTIGPDTRREFQDTGEG